MATAPTEDEKKRKAASFGDAAAAAQAPGTTQVATSPRRGYLSNPPAPPAPTFSTNVRVLSGGGAAPAVGSLPLTGSLVEAMPAPQSQVAPTQPTATAQAPKYESSVPLRKPDVPAVNAPGQAATTASAAPPAQAPGTISFDKATKTYSGQNIGADAQVVGGRGVGSISAQNNAAATALADQSSGLGLAAMQKPTQDQPQPGLGMNFGTPLSSANSWQARNDLRNLEVSASSIANRPDRNGNPAPAQQAYLNALAADQQARTGSDPGTVARTQAGAQMFGAAQAADAQRGATAAGLTQFGQRNKIDQARLGLDTQAAGFQAAGQKALADAQAGVLAAKTPQEQEAARQKLASIMGKGEPNYSNRYLTLAGGEGIDPTTKMPIKEGARVFDAASGAFINGGQAAKAATPPEGTRVRNADGSFGVIKNGILVKEF